MHARNAHCPWGVRNPNSSGLRPLERSSVELSPRDSALSGGHVGCKATGRVTLSKRKNGPSPEKEREHQKEKEKKEKIGVNRGPWGTHLAEAKVCSAPCGRWNTKLGAKL